MSENVNTISFDNINMTRHWQKAYRPIRILPPITPRSRKEIEEKPSSVIIKFIEGLSLELKRETDENIKESELYTKRVNTEPNIPKEKTLNNSSVEIDNSNPFITEANIDVKKRRNVLIRSTNLQPLPTNANLSNFQKSSFLNVYRRIRNYQPHIDEDWKSKLGLTTGKQSTLSILSSMMNNIDFQSKVIHDQIKLLMDNISYYKLSVVTKENYLESFKSLSLKSQIKYNKYLEETCGIMLLLPQLLLLEFYHFIEKFNNVNVPDKKKFKEKYIFDEVECLFYNNNLLSDVVDFFNSCFDVYSTLVKEVEDMFLKTKNFENLITIIEKARYNISSVISNSENAMSNYENDIKLIDKILKNEHKETKFQKERKNLTDKLRAQFIFKKNSERQRIMRIENALKLKSDEENEDYRNPPQFKFNSVIHTKLIDGLLDYCRKGVKKQIQSRRIMDEMKPPKKNINQTREAVKLNF